MSRLSLHEEFEVLENQMQELMSLCSVLRIENQSLKEQQDSLIEERAKLIEKNEMARSKVEQMIVRLKAMEASQ